MSKDGLAAGVVLAAGAGTRFGMPKVLAGQGEWLRRAVHALSEGGCAQVYVVLGAAIVEVPMPAQAVVAEGWDTGMSAALRAGMSAISGNVQFAVLHLVDTPDIGADVVARTLAAAIDARAGIARAVFHGRPGHPVVIARRHWPALLATLSGDRGARDFLAVHSARDQVVTVECGDLATGADIDEL